MAGQLKAACQHLAKQGRSGRQVEAQVANRGLDRQLPTGDRNGDMRGVDLQNRALRGVNPQAHLFAKLRACLHKHRRLLAVPRTDGHVIRKEQEGRERAGHMQGRPGIPAGA